MQTSQRRRPWARSLLGAASILAMAVSVMYGAEAPPPEGVALDATVTVTFSMPASEGGHPITDAIVGLTIARGGEPIQSLTEVTDGSGVAVFSGVARATSGEPTVASAYASTAVAAPDDGCVVVSAFVGWSGEADVDLMTVIDIEGTAEDIEICAGDGEGGGSGFPDGVVTDGTATVTVLDEHAQPLPGASVTMLAFLEGDESTTFWKTGGETDSGGVLTLTELPRTDAGGPVVVWWFEAMAFAVETVDGCDFYRNWYGTLEVAAVAGETYLDVPTERRDEGFGQCQDPGEGAPVLDATIRWPDGTPVSGAFVQLSVTRADGATWWPLELFTDGSGGFSIPIQPWGTLDEPATLGISVRGGTSRTEPAPEAGCEVVYEFIASHEAPIALADGGTIDPVALTMEEVEAGTFCDEIPGSEDGASGGGPRTTLPPTDAVGAIGDSAGPPTGALGGALLALAIAGLAALAVLHRPVSVRARRR